jgi:hypothetical protein
LYRHIIKMEQMTELVLERLMAGQEKTMALIKAGY